MTCVTCNKTTSFEQRKIRKALEFLENFLTPLAEKRGYELKIWEDSKSPFLSIHFLELKGEVSLDELLNILSEMRVNITKFGGTNYVSIVVPYDLYDSISSNILLWSKGEKMIFVVYKFGEEIKFDFIL